MNRDVDPTDPTDDPAPETATAGRSFVAVVGIDRYRLLRPLANAVSDARGALALFQRLGFEEAAAPLFDAAATGPALHRLVSDDLSGLGPDDNLVLFFAGHGTTTVSTFPDGLAIKTGYLLPVEAGRDARHSASWVKLDSWLEDVSRLPPRHILVILDACYSGISLGPLITWRGSDPPVAPGRNSLSQRRSRRVITSALDNQPAMDSGPVPGHSLFTGCLIEALTGGLARDGAHTTGSALGLYLQQRVTSYPQSQQTPDFGALAFDARGEMTIPILGIQPAAAGAAVAPEHPAAAPRGPIIATTPEPTAAPRGPIIATTPEPTAAPRGPIIATTPEPTAAPRGPIIATTPEPTAAPRGPINATPSVAPDAVAVEGPAARAAVAKSLTALTGVPSMEPVIETAAHQVDVIILTASSVDYDAVLAVDAPRGPIGLWDLANGPSGLPIAFRSFPTDRGAPLRVAVAVASDPGASAATNTLVPLADLLKPRCIAMCGTCVGRPGKTHLGDVVVAERLFYHDVGKQISNGTEPSDGKPPSTEFQRDLTTYKLRDDWKVALERFDPVKRFGGEPWFQGRPIAPAWREIRALVALRDGTPSPWTAVDPALGDHGWPAVLESLREKELLSGRKLTSKALQLVDDFLFDHMGKLPDLSPAASFEPFRVHVAPIATGSKVIADPAIWNELSRVMRKTLAVETEAAALGELAHRQRQYQLDAIAMKGIASFADDEPDERFRAFAARASAECLFWFLRDRAAGVP